MIIKLNKPGLIQPSWWVNFVNYVYEKNNTSVYTSGITLLNTEFSFYGAKVEFNEVIFEDDAMCTLFLLRWS